MDEVEVTWEGLEIALPIKNNRKMDLFEVKNSTRDKLPDGQDSRTVCYLTLGDMNSLSENRYYVRLTGKEAGIDWQVGDRLMLNLSLTAYKTQGQWQFNDSKDTIQLIEIKGEYRHDD